jgi:hypothetical protein
VLVGAALLNAAWSPPGGWYAASLGRGPAPSRPVAAIFESNVLLRGFDLPSTSARPGEAVPLTLHWAAAARVTRNLRVFVHLVAPGGAPIAVSDKFHPGQFADLPTGRWPAGFFLQDEHVLNLDPAAPPGRYRLLAGLWEPYSGARMRLLDPAGAPTSTDAATLMDDFVVEALP